MVCARTFFFQQYLKFDNEEFSIHHTYMFNSISLIFIGSKLRMDEELFVFLYLLLGIKNNLFK